MYFYAKNIFYDPLKKEGRLSFEKNSFGISF
jgi:hypothetical protein